MKLKYKTMQDEFEASKWHASEKEMQRKITGIRSPFYLLIMNLFRLANGYGENPSKAGLVLITLLLLAFLSLGAVGLSSVKDERIQAEYSEATGKKGDQLDVISLAVPDSFSINYIGISTIEYLTYQKTVAFEPAERRGRIIKLIFQLLVPIQATLFIFALRNRFRR